MDATGFSGELFHYVHVMFFTAGALLIFCYLWSKGQLNMDEEPKVEMMLEDDNG